VTKQSQGEKRDCFATLWSAIAAMTLSVVGLQNLGMSLAD